MRHTHSGHKNYALRDRPGFGLLRYSGRNVVILFHPIFLEPFGDIFLERTSAGVVDGKAFANFCVGGEFRDGGNALPETPAAVRAEWQNPFARKVVGLQQCRDRRGN